METTRVNLQDYKKWDTQQGELEGGRNHLWHWIFCIEYLQQAIFHMTSQQTANTTMDLYLPRAIIKFWKKAEANGQGIKDQ